MIPFDTKEIDFSILTHVHNDHCGLFPVLVSQGYYNPIFMSYPSFRLIPHVFKDSYQIEKNKKKYLTPFTEKDVENTLALTIGCQYKKIIKPHKHIKFTFFANGHLVGAVTTLVTISYPERENINIIYTGDYKEKNYFFNVEKLPNYVLKSKISAVFCESTYGNIDSTHPSFAKCFIKNIIQALEERKTIILPAFSLQRTQEILYELKMAQKKGLIPIEIPIWLDGYLSQQYTMLFQYEDLGIKKLMRNFLPQNFHVVNQKNRKKIREDLIRSPEQKIIIASSGMASFGCIQKYISSYLTKEKALIHFLGYCSPDSNGYQLIHTETGGIVNYAGKKYKKMCEVKQTGEFSAHAKRNELRDFLSYFENLTSVVITHGEPEVKISFQKYLEENLPNTNIQVQDPDIIFSINTNGTYNSTPNILY